MKDFWNEKFNTNNYIYGKEPNVYLAEKLNKLKPGKILFAAEGEGRNSVYAAKKGWQVEAFDLSEKAQEKALKYAEENQVEINYSVKDFLQIPYDKNSFDAIALIYAHFEKGKKKDYHKKTNHLLKKGGYLIFEGFGQQHPYYQEKYPNIGGPKNPDLLFAVEELKGAFPNYEFIELCEVETTLNEGEKHMGKGAVVRMFAKKKQ